MKYLLIENGFDQEPDIKTITVLGASTSRGKEEKIGQFGSGFLYTLALFARKNLLEKMRLYIGKTLYIPLVREHSNGLKTISLYRPKQNDQDKLEEYDLNISTDFGVMDWHKTEMGLRELVSNAIDSGLEYTVRLVDDEEEMVCGTTKKISVYLGLTNPSVSEFHKEVGKWFLMLTNDYNPDKRVMVNKEKRGARFYRKGVLCGEMKEGENSLFDYNIKELSLKESRIRDSSVEIVGQFLKAMLKEETVWEAKLNDRYLSVVGVYGDRRKEITETWVTAYKSVFGNKIPVDNTVIDRAVTSKGYPTVACNNKTVLQVLEMNGVKTYKKILSADEREGRIIIEPTEACYRVLDTCWRKLIEFNLIGRENEKPKLKCFEEITKQDSTVLGFHKEGVVYINNDIADERSFLLTKVMLEEVTHHVTGAEDFTRDFQDFAFRVATKTLYTKPN